MTAVQLLAGPARRLPVNSLTGTTVIGTATVVLALVAAATVDGFASSTNLRGLGLSVSLIGIVAVGLSLITIVGKVFSLAIPATIALSTILFASTLQLGSGVALLLAVLMSTAIGLAQGIIVGKRDRTEFPTPAKRDAGRCGMGQQARQGQLRHDRGAAPGTPQGVALNHRRDDRRLFVLMIIKSR